MRKKRRKLIVVGQIPPPFHGQSVMIQSMVDGLSGRLDLELVPMRFSREVDENGNFSFGKVFHLLGLVWRVWGLLLKHPHSVLYYPPAPPKWRTVLRDWVFLALVRPFARKILFHFHAYGLGEFLEQSNKTIFLKLPFGRPDAAVVLGQRCRKDAEVLDAKETFLVPYGVDVNVSDKLCSSNDFPRILFVGLHIESKGILDILETAAQLRDRGMPFEIRMVGPWKNEKIRFKFERRRRALGLESQVVCCGELKGDSLWVEYAKADMFFFPTFFEYETFGVVVIEAMAYGLPVVCSDWRGPGDVVEDGITGFVCPVHDCNAYAGALQRLSGDDYLRAQMGTAAENLYAERYESSCFVGRMEGVFVSMGVRRLGYQDA